MGMVTGYGRVNACATVLQVTRTDWTVVVTSE
jgi:hypothetical protein